MEYLRAVIKQTESFVTLTTEESSNPVCGVIVVYVRPSWGKLSATDSATPVLFRKERLDSLSA